MNYCPIRSNDTIQYATGCLEIVEFEIEFTLYVVTRDYVYEPESMTKSIISNIMHNAKVVIWGLRIG